MKQHKNRDKSSDRIWPALTSVNMWTFWPMSTSYYISTQYSRVKHQGRHFELNYTPVKFPDCTKQMLPRGVKCEGAICLMVRPHLSSFKTVSCVVVMLLHWQRTAEGLIKTWQGTPNCFCGSSCCKRCFQGHIFALMTQTHMVKTLSAEQPR